MSFQDYSLRKKRIISVLILSVILVLTAVVTYIFRDELAMLTQDPETVKQIIDSYGILGPLAFILMFIAQIIIAFIPGEPLEIAAGYAFGLFVGTLVVWIGTTAGSVIVYFLTRRYGTRFVELFIPRERFESIEYLKSSKKLRNIMFVLFLVPGTPKDVMTYFIGLTDIGLGELIVILSIARFPSAISSVIAGYAIVSKNSRLALTVFAVTVVLSVIGIYLYNRYVERKNKE